MASELPADGVTVTAMTYANEDEQIPAREVTGELSTRRVEWLNRTQCYVDGVQVDPETVRLVK